MDDVFKAYDIRGIVPDQLDASLCEAVGSAVARFTGADRVLVARDMRESGVALSAAFADGVRAEGTAVTDLGLASTDLLYFASGRLDAPGAMFTASHNPAAYNGIKLCLSGARPVGQDTGLTEIQAMAEETLAGRRPPEGVAPGPLDQVDLLEAYAEHVRSFIDTEALRPLVVVADTANGMGGLVAPAVFGPLPVELHVLYPELDGTFPNHPADPIQPANLVDLKAAVLERGADVGLAFDGDADRVFLVDERAESVSGSLTTALVASAMLEAHPGSTVLYNLICSHVVPEVIAEHGGTAVRTRVGHSFIKQRMAETGAVFGGEHSGHYYFRENYRADSGLIAALVVLELLSKSAGSLSELLAPYQRYADSGEINTEVPDPAAAATALGEHFERSGTPVDRLDGITVTFDDWWCNIRPSNTEPLLRLNVEARIVEDCQRHVDELVELIGTVGRGASSSAPSVAARAEPSEEAVPPEEPEEKDAMTTLDPLLLEVLACPVDKGPLLFIAAESTLYNPRLQRAYTVADGVPVMLVDESRQVDGVEHQRLMALASATGAPETGPGAAGAGAPASASS